MTIDEDEKPYERAGRNASGHGFSPRKRFFLAKNVNIKSRIFSTEISEIFVKLSH